MDRIVLAYSGGLDTSVAIAWLAEKYHAEVIALTLDLGQGRELTDVRERALAMGAVRAHVIDVRDEFAREFILPALQAGALYEDRYPLATALGRPLIARKLVEIARIEGATIVAHGCNGKANDELRLELAVRALDPVDDRARAGAELGHVAGRGDRVRARRGGSRSRPRSTVPIPSTPTCGAARSNAASSKIRGRSPPEDIYALTRSPQTCPNEPAYVEIEFEQGVPLRANGIEMPLVELIESSRPSPARTASGGSTWSRTPPPA